MPVVGKDAAEISARAATFRALAEIQLEHPAVVEANVAFDNGSALLMSEAYFALSEAYKKRRLKGTSRTEWCKAAALVAVSVSIVRPLRPAGPSNEVTWPYLNPNFGMLCAYGHAQEVFFATTFDAKRRLLHSLHSARLPCLDQVIAEANKLRTLVTQWDLVLSDDELSYLDSLVVEFEALIELQILKDENEVLRQQLLGRTG